jgi:hypothetical protein
VSWLQALDLVLGLGGLAWVGWFMVRLIRHERAHRAEMRALEARRLEFEARKERLKRRILSDFEIARGKRVIVETSAEPVEEPPKRAPRRRWEP